MASISGNVTVAGDPDDWIACAFDADTHAFAGVAAVSGGTYEITGLTAGKAYVVSCRPKSGGAWQPEYAYSVADYGVPTDVVTTPYGYKCTNAEIGDSLFDDVTLLIPCNGADNSTTFTDITGKTISVYLDAKIKTNESKFGGSSAYFDGNGDRINPASSSDFAWGTGDFTVEFFIYFPAFDKTRYFASSAYAAAAYFYLKSDNTGKIAILGAGFGTLTQSDTLSSGVWHHLAFVRNSGNTTLFVNGTSKATSTSSANFSTGQPLYFGGTDFNIAGEPDFGYCYMNDIRVTNAARYTGNFTAPAVPSPQQSVIPSGETEPTWPTTPGDTVIDGGVTWTNMGQLVQPLMQGPLVAA